MHTRKLFLPIIFGISLVSCTTIEPIPLGQEKLVQGEENTIRDISRILTDNLREQYTGEKFLRDTHPKANGCLHGNFTINSDINKDYQYGIFQPSANYPVWLRFSNSVEELTNDEEKDFRGLAMKITQVNGDRVTKPGDEQHTQDFLFLGHNAFFAATPLEFFDFFEAAFSDKSIWFLLTHPKGALNIFQGRKQFKTPLNVPWNSVTAYALGPKETINDPEYGEITAHKNVVRYRLQKCSMNTGNIPNPATPDYLQENMQAQLNNKEACFDFYIQKQVDPIKMPVENALVAWDEGLSPFIKIAQIKIPKQHFTSEPQKEFCENMSFNPGHSLVAHDPLGGINRARKVVMKDISDLRLLENNVPRFEPTGYERFE